MTFHRRAARHLLAQRRERGQVTLEFVALLPVILLVGGLSLQAYITVTASERVHNAARTAARLMVKNDLSRAEAREVARETLPEWLMEKPDLSTCREGDNPDSGNCLPDRICQDGEDPAPGRCIPQNVCVEDGEEKPWEKTCVSVGPGAKVTVKAEIPLFLRGGPMIFPVEDTVSMPGGGTAVAPAAAPGSVSGRPAENRETGKAMAAARGWTEDNGEWQCLDWVWKRESGWRVDADSPASSAYGIPQANPGSKMSDAGTDWQTSARTQIQWGLNYIADKYGTPCDAKAHWEVHHWY